MRFGAPAGAYTVIVGSTLVCCREGWTRLDNRLDDAAAGVSEDTVGFYPPYGE